MSLELSGVKPAAVHLSTCLVSARPPCPYVTPGEFAEIIEK